MTAQPDTPNHCPCGAELKSAAGWARGVCDYCRVGAKKKPRKRRPKPDFVDVPIPGFEDWGAMSNHLEVINAEIADLATDEATEITSRIRQWVKECPSAQDVPPTEAEKVAEIGR